MSPRGRPFDAIPRQWASSNKFACVLRDYQHTAYRITRDSVTTRRLIWRRAPRARAFIRHQSQRKSIADGTESTPSAASSRARVLHQKTRSISQACVASNRSPATRGRQAREREGRGFGTGRNLAPAD